MKRILSTILAFTIVFFSSCMCLADDTPSSEEKTYQDAIDDLNYYLTHAHEADVNKLTEIAEQFSMINNYEWARSLRDIARILVFVEEKEWTHASRLCGTLTKGFEDYLGETKILPVGVTVEAIGSYIKARQAEDGKHWEEAIKNLSLCPDFYDSMDRLERLWEMTPVTETPTKTPKPQNTPKAADTPESTKAPKPTNTPKLSVSDIVPVNPFSWTEVSLSNPKSDDRFNAYYGPAAKGWHRYPGAFKRSHTGKWKALFTVDKYAYVQFRYSSFNEIIYGMFVPANILNSTSGLQALDMKNGIEMRTVMSTTIYSGSEIQCGSITGTAHGREVTCQAGISVTAYFQENGMVFASLNAYEDLDEKRVCGWIPLEALELLY